MTTAQNRMYWGEWAEVKKTVAKRGITGPGFEELRHKLHVRALGHDKSSSKLTNVELDRVLAAFRAESKPADFAAQMAVQDSPDVRRQDLQARCWEAVSVFVRGEDIGHSNSKRQAYLDGTAKKIFRTYFDQLEERQLQQLMGILERRVRQLDGKAVKKAVAMGEASDEAPIF